MALRLGLKIYNGFIHKALYSQRIMTCPFNCVYSTILLRALPEKYGVERIALTLMSWRTEFGDPSSSIASISYQNGGKCELWKQTIS